ncbi:MAG: tetratricopeptide repeat protein [Bacteroidales bacterium]|nr:tetratricopeptide repeat protein [Bacteroidales bacterium]
MPFFLRTISVALIIWLFIPSRIQAETYRSIDSLQQVLKHSKGIERLETYHELVKSLRNIDPSKGIEYAREAVKLADSLQNYSLKARIIDEEGVCFRKLNIFDEALKMHFEALRMFDLTNDSVGISYAFANIGMVYLFFKDYENALDYHYRSLLIKEYLGDEAQIAYSQNSIGMVLVELGDYARALDYYISAMAIRKRLNDNFELANIYGNIGKVFVKLNRLDDATKYFELAREIYVAEKAEYGHSLIMNEIADLYLKKNQPDRALSVLKEAEAIAFSRNNLAVLLYNYKLQAAIYAQKKQFDKAYDYAIMATSAKDSLFSEQRTREMTEVKVQYETKRIDSENEILRLKLSAQALRLRYIFLSTIGIISLLIILFLVWRYLKNRRTNLQLAKLNGELEDRVALRTKELSDEISQKEKLLASLMQSEERFRAINEASPMGISVSDQNGLCVFTNQKLTQKTGISGNEFIQGTWHRHIYVDDRNHVETVWRNAHEKRLDGFEVGFRVRKDNKELRWVYLRATAMLIDHKFIGMVAMMEDITERKLFEEQLIKAKNKAEESDKLKSAFLANMSHEIRTPMNAILGFSDLLSSDDYDQTEKIEFLDMIKSSGRLLLNLINDIIDISKIEAGELKIQPISFSPAVLMSELQLTFRQQLDNLGKENVKLVLEYPTGFEQHTLFTDKLRLQQILTNLLSNAMKFTPEGQIIMGVLSVEGFYEFYVKDTGIGIPLAKLEVIFDRFRQADESHTRLYGGTGLGLAIVKNLVELLGGRIWVDSIVDKGTAFYFTLPKDKQDTEQLSMEVLSQPSKKEAIPDFSHHTILIAEDVDTNFHLIKTMLRRTKVKLLHAPNGLIAVDMAASDPKPDLILMDIQMPEMDGIEAMLKIRKQGNGIPMIAITAFALQGEDKYYTELGFDAYLSKPLSNDKLLETLKIFLAKS